jgi:phytoene/squalene synthetase
VSRPPAALAAAYAACASFAQSHSENFPVASRLLPAAMRPHVAAVYAYARIADDLADEGDVPAAVRRSRLEAWKERLHDAVAAPSRAPRDDGQDFVFGALSHSIRSLDLPLSLFDDLLSAFEQDITTHRYVSWRDLFDYCRRSANPVGRLVLRIAGYHAAADELLAGLRPGLACGTIVRAGRNDEGSRRRRNGSDARRADGCLDEDDRRLHRGHP